MESMGLPLSSEPRLRDDQGVAGLHLDGPTETHGDSKFVDPLSRTAW
jgi:hypothetical protein